VITEEMQRLDARLVDEALATLRAEAEERELADRVRRLCDDAVDAARAKRRELEDKR
jgi:hypothetical protein